MTDAGHFASRTRRWLALGVALAGAATNLATSIAVDTCAGGFVVQPSGDAQTGTATAPLGRPLLLDVRCRGSSSGNLVPAFDEEVTWTVASGGGRVDGRDVTSTRAGLSRYGSAPGFDTRGAVAAVHWQLGDALGEQTVEAKVAGQTFTFRATAAPPTPGGSCAGGGGTDLEEERFVAGDQRWVAAGSPYRGQRVRVQSGATLTVEAGSRTCLGDLVVEPGGALVVAGEPTRPVRMEPRAGSATGWRLELSTFAPWSPLRNEIRHLQALNLTRLQSQGPTDLADARLEIDSTIDRTFDCPSVQWHVLPDAAPSMQRVVIDGYGGPPPSGCAALYLFANTTPPGGPRPVQARVLRAGNIAVLVRGTAPNALALSACEISGAGRYGLAVGVDGRGDVLTMSGCNVTDNGEQALFNEAPWVTTVPARGNWWGNPSGPAAAGANSVSAGVDAGAPLAAPAVLGY